MLLAVIPLPVQQQSFFFQQMRADIVFVKILKKRVVTGSPPNGWMISTTRFM